MSKQLGQVDRDHREAINLRASIVTSQGRVVAARVLNMSLQGCLVQSHETMIIGERVTLNMAGFAPLPAQVRWELGGSAGLRFE